MNRNPVAFDFSSRTVISSSRSTVCHRDEDRVPVNDSNRGVVFAIYANRCKTEETGSWFRLLSITSWSIQECCLNALIWISIFRIITCLYIYSVLYSCAYCTSIVSKSQPSIAPVAPFTISWYRRTWPHPEQFFFHTELCEVGHSTNSWNISGAKKKKKLLKVQDCTTKSKVSIKKQGSDYKELET